MAINIDDIKNDKSIKEINVSNTSMDRDLADVEYICDVKESKKKGVIRITISSIMGLILGAIIILILYTLINFNIIQGHIKGEAFNIIGFSVVSKSYNPEEYLDGAKTIYYNGDKNIPFAFSSAYETGEITKIYSNKIWVQGKSTAVDKAVEKSEINYVLQD